MNNLFYSSLVFAFLSACQVPLNGLKKLDLDDPSLISIANSKPVTFTQKLTGGEIYNVNLDDKKIGEFERLRIFGELKGRVDRSSRWLVIEDGIGTDSYPNLSIYELKRGEMLPSKTMLRLKNQTSSNIIQGTVDPIFLGFNESGYPVIFFHNQRIVIEK